MAGLTNAQDTTLNNINTNTAQMLLQVNAILAQLGNLSADAVSIGTQIGIHDASDEAHATLFNALRNTVAGLRGDIDDIEASMVPDAAQAQYGLLLETLAMAGLAAREHEQTRLSRFQEITATIKNRGVVYGCTLTKTGTGRRLDLAEGKVFANGRTYPLPATDSAVAVPSNSGSASAVSIIYARLSGGVMGLAATALGGSLPDDGIEIARVTVPAGNTDVGLASCTVTDTARREPGWPLAQVSAAEVSVALNRVMPDTDYRVQVEVTSCSGGRHQLGEILAVDQLRNGCKLRSYGTCDNISCRLLVAHPGI